MTENSEFISRRKLLRFGLNATALYGAARVFPAQAANVVLPFDNGERSLVRFPQKRPLLRLSTRPPQLETPFAVFNKSVITPNDAFFVRYHLTRSPALIDPETFRLEVKGKVNSPLMLTLEDLKRFEPMEVVAVNQCSGNSRGFSNPRVAGGQLGHGAMGNARWKGVPLKAILDKAGVQEGAKQVTFNGADIPAAETTPDFIKSLDIDHARDGEVMVAYAMNNADLPILNGYPLRLVVPGYYGTYWVKHLNEITVIDTVYDGFWMKTAYKNSEQSMRLCRARDEACIRRAHQSNECPLVRHEPCRWREGFCRGPSHDQRYCFRWRLRGYGCCCLHRRRKDLARRRSWGRAREVFFQAMVDTPGAQ